MKRGQAMLEAVLGVLVLTPLLLLGLYLVEVANEKIVVTNAATEALWDATAYPHHNYAAQSFTTPSATAAAQVATQGRHPPRSRLFIAEKSLTVRCKGAGAGVAFSVPSTASFYKDLGGASCGARLELEATWLPFGFLDPEGAVRRAFELCETDRCQGFHLLMDDWGLTADNDESAECPGATAKTGGRQNPGYFLAGQTVYQAHRTANGTSSNADAVLVLSVLGDLPNGLSSVKDFQMSFRGEESGFTEQVQVSEGKADWQSTPFTAPWQRSYAARQEDFLGR